MNSQSNWSSLAQIAGPFTQPLMAAGLAVLAVLAMSSLGDNSHQPRRTLMTLGLNRFLAAAIPGTVSGTLMMLAMMVFASAFSDGYDETGVPGGTPSISVSDERMVLGALVIATLVVLVLAIVTAVKVQRRTLQAATDIAGPSAAGWVMTASDLPLTVVLAWSGNLAVGMFATSLGFLVYAFPGYETFPAQAQPGDVELLPLILIALNALVPLAFLAVVIALLRRRGASPFTVRVFLVIAALHTAGGISQTSVIARHPGEPGDWRQAGTIVTVVMVLIGLVVAWWALTAALGPSRADALGLAVPMGVGSLAGSWQSSLLYQPGARGLDQTASLASGFLMAVALTIGALVVSAGAAWFAYRRQLVDLDSGLAIHAE